MRNSLGSNNSNFRKLTNLTTTCYWYVNNIKSKTVTWTTSLFDNRLSTLSIGTKVGYIYSYNFFIDTTTTSLESLNVKKHTVSIGLVILFHIAWIWIWMTKRPGITSDGNFSSYLIGRSWYKHFQSFSMGGNGNNTIYPLLST